MSLDDVTFSSVPLQAFFNAQQVSYDCSSIATAPLFIAYPLSRLVSLLTESLPVRAFLEARMLNFKHVFPPSPRSLQPRELSGLTLLAAIAFITPVLLFLGLYSSKPFRRVEEKSECTLDLGPATHSSMPLIPFFPLAPDLVSNAILLVVSMV